MILPPATCCRHAITLIYYITPMPIKILFRQLIFAMLFFRYAAERLSIRWLHRAITFTPLMTLRFSPHYADTLRYATL